MVFFYSWKLHINTNYSEHLKHTEKKHIPTVSAKKCRFGEDKNYEDTEVQ